MTKEATSKKVILSTPGFPDISTSNIENYRNKMKQFLVDKKHKWFLHDTLGMTTTWKKGEKFERFVGAMQDNVDIPACVECHQLALEIADVNPKEIVFEPGSAAGRDIGRAIDKRLEKEELAAKSAEASAEVGEDGSGVNI